MGNLFLIIIISSIIIIFVNKHSKQKIVPYETDIFNDIPLDVRKLLYVSNDQPENINFGISIKIKINFETGEIESSQELADDPSTIYTKLDIAELFDNNIDKPSYYPSYASLDPGQRWYYLNWLKNIDSQVDIGFVFIFYYGLERHLFLENFDEAFDMIIRLRENHKNKSFQSYSLSALLNSCVLKNRTDRFSAIKTVLKEDIWGNNHLLICYWNNKQLNANEITKVISVIPKLNRRYIKQKRDLYVVTMREILISEFGVSKFLLNKFFDIREINKEGALAFANPSFPSEIKTMEIPNFLNDKKFIKIISKLHDKCHDAVKTKNRE